MPQSLGKHRDKPIFAHLLMTFGFPIIRRGHRNVQPNPTTQHYELFFIYLDSQESFGTIIYHSFRSCEWEGTSQKVCMMKASRAYMGDRCPYLPLHCSDSHKQDVCVWIFLIQQVRQVAACDWQLADAHMVCDAGIILFVFLVLRLFVITLTFVLHQHVDDGPSLTPKQNIGVRPPFIQL